jgi:hypothetical protein
MSHYLPFRCFTPKCDFRFTDEKVLLIIKHEAPYWCVSGLRDNGKIIKTCACNSYRQARDFFKIILADGYLDVHRSTLLDHNIK